MKKIKLFFNVVLIVFVMTNSRAQTSVEIEKANKAGKAVFLVVFNAADADALKTWNIAVEAQKKLPKKADVIKMNAIDATNAILVTKYRLSGAPLPMVLVIDKNGTVTEGLPLSKLTAENLVKLIPSPKYSEVLKALNNGKSIFVVAYKESMIGKKSVIKNCNDASKNLNNKNVVMAIDMNDVNEKDFLTNLKYNNSATEPQTFVINSKGQITATYNGVTKINELVASANKVFGGCCSGNNKSGCKR